MDATRIGGLPLVTADKSGGTPTNLTEVLDRQVRERPDKVVYTFLRDGEVESGHLTLRELRERAVAVAARLTSLNAPGQRAVLLYPQGLEFIVAFFGCLYAGVVAVPASLPDRKRGFGILRGIAANAGAKWLLSTELVLQQLSESVGEDPQLNSLARLDPEQWPPNGPLTWAPSPIAPEQTALLQYTSGSTGSPRGVEVTHANLFENQRQIEQSFGHTPETVYVSWLPMFHDMGLGTILQAMWMGGHCVLMSPRAFLQNPRRWLNAISNYRGASSGGPDFAYDLCARRISEREREGLDLSSWTIAYNGSEPVRAATIEHFSEAFHGCGFRREAFLPVYGLAEATLFVSADEPAVAPLIRSFAKEELELGQAEPVPTSGRGQALVSCGHTWGGETELCIIHPETSEECEAGRVGEIWIRGACVAAGYWGKEDESRTMMRVSTSDGRGPFLRTGDLGFIEEGHLYVTGRLKDLIIVRGRNHYPQDIEDSVSTCHPALVAHGCAAFSIDSDQGEQLVILQEVARSALRTLDTAAVIRAIRSVVSDHHALYTHAVVLLKPSMLPRTTSGKVRRKTCRQAFLEKSLPSVASWVAPMTPGPVSYADPDSERREVSGRADRLIDWLRRHAADLIASYASEERRSIPASLLRDFAKQGLIGMQVEPRYGGLGLGHTDTARVLEQLAAFDFALALFVGLNNYLGIQPVAKYAPPEIRALLLPGLIHGEELAAFAFEEPGSAKAPSGLGMQAQPDGEEHWRLFGAKYLDGVAQGASVISVFAHHEEPPGISSFVVSDRIDGLRHVRDGLSMGVLGFTRDSVVLDGVRVGRENLLGSLGSGIEIAREAMMHTRLAIAAACVGGMKRCAQIATRDGPYYGSSHGKLTPNPVLLSRLGSVTARVAALECLVIRIARAIDENRAMPAEAFAACKILAPELLLRSIDDLMQLGGQGGYAETNRISSLYRDAGLLRNFDGPPEAVAELTGAVVMEEDASLRLLIDDVFGAPDLVRWIEPVLETIRQRMMRLTGALARRAQRWGHTRAGELSSWLALLAAVEGSLRTAKTPELARAHSWARAQFEYALSSVRFGTPSETATLDATDLAATFAGYASTIGELDSDPSSRELALSDFEPWQDARPKRGPASVSGSGAPSGESSKRELRSWIISWMASRLQIPVAQIESSRSFADHGLDSVAAVELAKALSDELGRELEATLLWNFATIDALVEHFAPSAAAPATAPSAKLEAESHPTAPSVESRLDDEISRLEAELKSRRR